MPERDNPAGSPPGAPAAPQGPADANPYAPSAQTAPGGRQPDYPAYGPQSAGNPYQSPQAGGAPGYGAPQLAQYGPYPGAQAPGAAAPGRGKAIASLVLGLVSALTWLIPLLGLPTSVTGLALGIQSRGQHKSGMATAGVVLSAIFLGLTLINCIAGAYLGATGQHPLVN
jgi:hypothetical protein